MTDTTIVNTPASQDGATVATAAFSLIVILAVLAGGFLWYRAYGLPRAAAPAPDTANINITVPLPGADANAPKAEPVK